MNTKQKIKLFLVPILMLGTFVALPFAESDTAHALTDQEKKQCFQDWRGKTPGNANGSQAYRNSKCDVSKDGTCRVTRTSDNSEAARYRIDCKNKNGDFTASGNWNPVNDDDDDTTTEPVNDYDYCDPENYSIIKPDCSSTKDGNPIWGLLLMVINILTAGIGIVAVGGIIYAAILWTTAEDKNAQIIKAKETIFNVVLGLVAYALLYAFLQFLIPGGVF